MKLNDKEYFIGIMHTNRLDLLSEVIKAIEGEDAYLIDNSDERDFRGNALVPTQPMSYSQGMNTFREQALDLKTDFIVTMHEDIRITKETIKDLKDFILNVKGKWGIILTNEDSVCVYNTKLLKEQSWDTRLPDYFSDTDYQYWATIKGYKIIQSDVDVFHYRSQTIRSDPKKEFTNSITYPLYELYYMSKTGGKRGQERFNIPFNNPLYE